MNLREALAQITKRTAEYPQEAFEVIRAHKEEAKPYLREAIELAAEQGEDLDYEYQLYFYALFLLGEFQDRESFEHINLVVAVEDEFSFKIPMGKVVTMKNVGEMVDIILDLGR